MAQLQQHQQLRITSIVMMPNNKVPCDLRGGPVVSNLAERRPDPLSMAVIEFFAAINRDNV